MTGEKVSVNISDEMLSKIDLLVEDGFYANRSDFINKGVEMLLDKEARNIDKLLDIHSQEKIAEHQWFIGIQSMGTNYLEKVRERGLHLKIKGFGVLYFEKDIDAQLVFDTVEMISRKIKIYAEDSIKEHYKTEKNSRRHTHRKGGKE